MKKAILIIGTFLIGLCISSTAYAGSLNEYEAEVIAAANGRYEYNGTEYKLDPVYIAQLRGLLSDDNVDLTEDQMNVVLQSINDYIKAGVEEGYLIPANSNKSASGDAASKDNKQDDNGSTASAGKKADTEEPSGDEFMGGLLSDNQKPPVQQDTKEVQEAADSSGNTKNPSGNTENPVQTTAPEVQGTDKSGTVTKETDPGAQGYNPFTDNPGSNGTKDGDDGTNDGSDGANDGSNGTKDSSDGTKEGSYRTKDGSNGDKVGSTDASGNSIIKDTGFNLIRPVIAAVLLGVLMLAGIIVTIKFNYFTQIDE